MLFGYSCLGGSLNLINMTNVFSIINNPLGAISNCSIILLNQGVVDYYSFSTVLMMTLSKLIFRCAIQVLYGNGHLIPNR